MRFIITDDQSLAAGRKALDRYSRGLLCGPGTEAYKIGIRRPTGAELLPGAMIACVERGIREPADLLAAASRATRVRGGTGDAVMRRLLSGRESLLAIDEYGLLRTRGELRTGHALSLDD